MKFYFYYIADILTASRFVFAAVIVAMTAVAAPAGWVLAVFAVGELTDAADGPAANRWPYPQHLEKELWWRRNTVAFDIAADMALGTATLVYCALHTYPFGMTLLIGAVVIATGSQLLVLFVLPPPERSTFTKWLILLRRALLYVPAISVVVIMLLLKATVPGELTWAAVGQSVSFQIWLGVGLTIGAVVTYLKRDRIAEVAKRKTRVNP